jgi:ferredoxin
VKRKIVNIDEKLCNGCGQCIPKCAEGALQIINCKAKIVKDSYCDGLGACLGYCPQGAITITERDAEEFDQEKVNAHINIQTTRTQTINNTTSTATTITPQKPQWPIKIELVAPNAQFFENANILLTADCVPVVLKNFHEIATGKQVIICCPKVNDARTHATKLTEILKLNNIISITVIHMEVPCCAGLKWATNKALEATGKKIPVKELEIKIGGEPVEFKG